MTAGLVLTALALGVRHGVDWDHIAAIADLTGTAGNRRRGLLLSLLYAVGHAIVVFALGAAAIVLGMKVPAGLDAWMGRFVGLTLVGLGVWVLVGLLRERRDFRLRSRWMLVLHGTFAGVRRVRRRRTSRSISVEHDHEHDHDGGTHDDAFAHDHSHRAAGTESRSTAPAPVAVSAGPGRSAGRPPVRRHRHHARHHHRHRHDLLLPDSASARYEAGTATGIGMLHGVGVESPTQIAIFVASTSVAGAAGGLTLLLAWIVGLVVANLVLAVLAGAGLLHAERNFAVYATVAAVVAVMSIAMGAMYAAGFDALPEIAP